MSPRARPPERWPWPGDSPLQRRERIAQGYRDALRRADPSTAQLLDDRCRAWGQAWVLADRAPLPDDQLLDTAEVAQHRGVEPRTVDQWRHRDGLAATETPDGVRYRAGDVADFLRSRRAGRLTDTPVTQRTGSVRNE